MDTKMTTPELVRFSYVNLETAKLAPGATDPSFGMSVIIPKKNKKTIEAVRACIEAAIELGKEKYGKKWVAKKLPLRDGDEEREDAAYADSYFFNANKKEKQGRPGLVDRNKQQILDLKEIKSGDWGCVSLNFYPFNVNGNSGVAVGLNHVQKVKDGEPLGSVSNAEDDFEKFEDDQDDIM